MNLLIDFERGRIYRHIKKYNTYSIGGANKKYIQIFIDGNLVYLHRYLYEKYYGITLKSSQYLYHINGNTNDNRICNLGIIKPIRRVNAGVPVIERERDNGFRSFD